jgi:hypothetical protein
VNSHKHPKRVECFTLLAGIIKGDDSSVLKEKLDSRMIKESEAVETISDLTTLIAEGNKHGVEDEVEGKIEHEDTHYNLHTDLTNNINNNLHTESPNTTSYLNSTIAQRSAERFTANGIHDSEINKLN